MKRFALAAVLISALALSAVALGATSTYSGSLKKGGTLTFKIETKAGKKVLNKFSFQHVPIKCKNGPATTSGQDQLDDLPIKNSKFDVKLNASDPTLNATLVFKGTLHGKNANGTFHLSGKKVPLDGGSLGKNCETGILNWDASTN